VGYTKLFQKILASSVWNEDLVTKVVWVTLLALKDQHHIVAGSVGGIAHQARVSLEECRVALEKLSAPDPDDTSGIDEGRRIKRVEGVGWLVTNGQMYRESKDEDERRAWMANYMREYRQKQKERKQNVNNGKHALTDVMPVNTSDHIISEQNRTKEIKRPAASPQFITREMVEEHCRRKHWSHKLISIAWAKLMSGKYYGTPITDEQTFSDTMETIYADWKP
jgi:hypothetical protein